MSDAPAAYPTFGGEARSELARADAYYYAGEHAKALEALEGHFQRTARPSVTAYVALARACQALERHGRALEAAADGVAAWPDARQASELADLLAANLRLAPPDADRFNALFPKVVLNDRATEALLVERARHLSEAGDPSGALAYARLHYALAPIEQVNVPIGWITRCLRAIDLDMARVDRFIAFQEHGPAGPDGRMGTADDLADRLRTYPPPSRRRRSRRWSAAWPSSSPRRGRSTRR